MQSKKHYEIYEDSLAQNTLPPRTLYLCCSATIISTQSVSSIWL